MTSPPFTLKSTPTGPRAGQSLFLTVEETGALLAVRPKQIYELVKRGALPSVRLGRLVRIPRAAIEAMARGKLTPPSQAA